MSSIASKTAPQSDPRPRRPAQEFKLVQTRRTFEEVTAQVREMLFDGSLRPGDRLPAERDLARTLGIGRPALREALRSLEANGLIELRRGKNGGVVISGGKPSVVSEGMSDLLRLGRIPVEELFEARRWIQMALVRVACHSATDDDIRRLRENVAHGEKLHHEGRDQERIAVNIEFHSILAEATRNQVAMIVVRGLTDALRTLISEVGSDPVPSLFRDRRAVIKALEARDENAAAKAMEKLLHTTEQSYKRLAEKRASGGASRTIPARKERPAGS